jgi:hypothetical protein
MRRRATDPNHFPGGLVTQNERGFNHPVAKTPVFQEMQVGAANTDMVHSDQQLVRPGGRPRTFFNPHDAWGVHNSGLHGFFHVDSFAMPVR